MNDLMKKEKMVGVSSVFAVKKTVLNVVVNDAVNEFLTMAIKYLINMF